MHFGPTDLRATFELFRFYRPEVGLRALLQDAGIGPMSLRQIYHAVHNRPPDMLPQARRDDGRAIETFIAALSSMEFQQNFAAHILRAFPEKKRLFFVHIPKTAGVDLATHLVSRHPSISTTLLDRVLTPSMQTIFLTIKYVVLEMSCSDTIFVSGHTPLGTYQRWTGNGIRSHDHVFTVVREPLEQIVSQINYTLGRMFSIEDPIASDTAGWRRLFGVDNPDRNMSRHELIQLAQRILRDPGVVVPNVICSYLGGGTCERAVVQTAAHDLEVVDMKMLDAWAEQKWDVTNRTQRNKSEKFVSMEDFSTDDMNYARGIVQEDVRYHRIVMDAYTRHGGLAVRGGQIIE